MLVSLLMLHCFFGAWNHWNQHEVGAIFGVTPVQRPARPSSQTQGCGKQQSLVGQSHRPPKHYSFGTQLDSTGHLCSSYVPSMEKMFLYAFILLIFLDWVFKPVISIYTSIGQERLVYQSFKSNFAALVDGLFYFQISKSEMMIPVYFHKFGTCTLKTTQGEAKPKPSGAPLPDLAHDRRLAREVAGEVARPGATRCSTQLGNAGLNGKIMYQWMIVHYPLISLIPWG